LLSSSFATLLAVLASDLHTEVSSNVAYLWFYLGAGIVFCLIGCISLLLWRVELCGAAIPTWVIKHTAFIARHIMWSKSSEELHQGNILFPMLQSNSSTDFASRECLGLHFQIDFCVNVRGIERNVTQPGADV
jgi:hypothetical protein